MSDGSAYTLGCLAAYFAANGVSYEDADDLWWWGQNHLEELRNRYLCSESLDAVAILSVVNADWGIRCHAPNWFSAVNMDKDSRRTL